MGKAGLKHVSVRVPWHDNMWNGRICRDVAGNSTCLALKRTAENRDDPYEIAHQGEGFDDIPKMPPCLAERGAFLSPFPLNLRTQLAYSKQEDGPHGHILATEISVPAYGGVLTPYRWMLREFAFPLAEERGLGVLESQEPQEGEAPDSIVDTAWVQNADNQRELLEGFRKEIGEQASLVFFYAKQTPLSEAGTRQIVAVAKLENLGKVDEYPYAGGDADGRIRSMIWERPFQHSLRPVPEEKGGGWAGGVVLPYHELVELAESDESIELEALVARVPDEAYEQFLYGTDHVTHGSAITSLLSVRKALEAYKTVLAGPFERYIEWIDRELASIWRMRGPAPGLGSALSCFDPKFNGALFAYALAAELDDNVDPWPTVEAVLSGEREAPQGSAKITKGERRRWAYLRDNQPEQYQLMKLLSCFELTKDQVKGAFLSEHATALLKNPYRLYETTRLLDDAIDVMTIDRALFPSKGTPPAPWLLDTLEVELDEPEDPLRLRAFTVDVLERAADEGHTLLSPSQLEQLFSQLPLSEAITLDRMALLINQADFAPEVNVWETSEGDFAQLRRYVTTGEVIRSHVQARIDKGEVSTDWRPLVELKFGNPQQGGDDEIEAQSEKIAALKTLEASRIGVLTGPAGTGKTTLLKIFLDQRELVGPDVLLLAPTGKARVRLGQQTGRPEQAQTLAQFLLAHGRYDRDTARYLVRTEGETASVSSCIVDECSMLTEDQLASLLSALPKSARIILVGDPQQLPPIGAGRPFVDIIEHLRTEHDGSGLAELTVSRRQQGDELIPALTLPDVQLANLFSGRPTGPGEDEILAAARSSDADRLKFLEWDTPQNLREKLLNVLTTQFQTDKANLEREVELTLGGVESGGYIYFNRGAGAKAEIWQILSANRNQLSGSAELNRFIKQAARADRLETGRDRQRRGWRQIEPRGSDQITYGDKVICLRNHRRTRWSTEGGKRDGYLANGEIGMVIGDAGKSYPRWTKVEFASQPSETYSFPKAAFSEEGNPFLELAYAVTVHKAQGSEFDTVILILPRNSRLLTREMLYTALTRQKARVWILHQGPFAAYHRLQSDFFSETKRRATNLFAEPAMYEASLDQPGGTQKRWLAENLIHATRSGELVRSKSELIIADMLHEREKRGGLRYSYEQPLSNRDGETRIPDFTIDADSGTWYWEHCGMMGKPQYVERWNRKLAWFEAQKITRWNPSNPEGRLIVTEDNLKGGIDSGAIHQLIEELFAPPSLMVSDRTIGRNDRK